MVAVQTELLLAFCYNTFKTASPLMILYRRRSLKRWLSQAAGPAYGKRCYFVASLSFRLHETLPCQPCSSRMRSGIRGFERKRSLRGGAHRLQHAFLCSPADRAPSSSLLALVVSDWNCFLPSPPKFSISIIRILHSVSGPVPKPKRPSPRKHAVPSSCHRGFPWCYI